MLKQSECDKAHKLLLIFKLNMVGCVQHASRANANYTCIIPTKFSMMQDSFHRCGMCCPSLQCL